MNFEKLFNNLFRKRKLVYYYDIPSSNKFLSFRKARPFNLDIVGHYIDLLSTEEDELSISIPSNNGSSIIFSIWGVDSKYCELERVVGSKCSSYWLKIKKEKVKIIIQQIEDIAVNPEEFGLILKIWD